MTNYGPWSVKGIDQRAREAAREAAREEGLTIGEYINRMLLEETEEEAPSARDWRTPRYPRTVEPERDEYRRTSGRGTFDQLIARLEAVEARSTLALTGIDQSIVGLVARLNKTDAKADNVADSVESFIEDLRDTHETLQDKVRALEEDETGARNLETLKSLEKAIGQLATRIHEEASRQRSDSDAVRGQIEQGLGAIDGRIGGVEDRVDAKLAETTERFHKRIAETEARSDGVARQVAERFDALDTSLASRLSRVDRFGDRIDAVEGDVAGALTSIESVMTRMQERLQRAESTTNAALSGLERTFESLDKRITAIAAHSSPEAAAALRSQFEARFEGLAGDLRSSIETAREELAREIEQAAVTGIGEEKVQALESSVEGLGKRMSASEERSSRALESMTDQVSRISTSFDKRLREVEARDPGEAVETVRQDMAQLSSEVSDRLEQFSTQNDEVIDRITDQMKSLADQFDSRVEESERRSASAIEQVGEQVAGVANRLQARQDRALDEMKVSLEASRKQQALKLSDALSGVSDRLDAMQRHQASALSPVQKAIASLATRLEALEDFTSPPHSDAAPLAEPDFRVQDFADLRDDAEPADMPGFEAPEEDTVETSAEEDEQEFEIAIDDPDFEDDFGDDDAFQAGLPDISEIEDEPVEVAGEFEIPEYETELAEEPAAQDEDPLAELTGWDDGRDETRDSDIFGDEAHDPAAAASDESALFAEDDLTDADDDDAPVADAAGEYEVPLEDDAEAMDYLSRARKAAMAATAAHGGRGAQLAAANGGAKRSNRVPLVAAVSVVALATAAAGTYFTLRGLQDDPGKPVVESQEPVIGEATRAAMLTPEMAEPVMAEMDAGELPLIEPLEVEDMAGLSESEEVALDAELFEEPVAETRQEPAPEPATPPAPTVDFASLPVIPNTPTLESAASNGDALAQLVLGEQRLDAGDYTGGPSLVRKAAEAGEPAAQYRLAKLHEKGLGVPRDLAMAREWTARAAEGGNVKAMHDLAVYYAEGEGGQQSYAAAVEWFRKAAEYGLTDSQYNLAVLYEAGLGISPSQTEALYWYEVAARQGDTGAPDKVAALREAVSLETAQQVQRRAATWSAPEPDARANGRFDAPSWQSNPQAQVSAVQSVLGALGYEPGPADGLMGAGTIDAIRAYQAEAGLDATGTITPDLVRSLNETVEARTRTG